MPPLLAVLFFGGLVCGAAGISLLLLERKAPPGLVLEIAGWLSALFCSFAAAYLFDPRYGILGIPFFMLLWRARSKLWRHYK